MKDVDEALTTGRDKAYWYMFEPLMMSKAVFDKLPKDQQAVIMTVGAEMEQFATKAAQADDIAVAQVYQKAGAKVVDLNAEVVKKWQDIARNTAWKDFAGRNASCAKLLALAEKTV